MGRSSTENARGGVLGWMRKVDDAAFAVEQIVVVTFLVAMTVMVFLDVVYRRLVAPDSKLGGLIARIGGIDDPATKSFLDGTVAPALGIPLGVGLLWFAFWTAERRKGAPLLALERAPLVLALATALVCALLGWMMVALESRYVYLILYAAAAVTWVALLVRSQPAGWAVKVGVLVLVITPAFVYVALHYFPRGYSWSKELSLLLLLWVGFLGASVCAHEGKHLRMEAFDKLIPPAIARWLRAVGYLATAAFCIFMTVLGYRYIFDPTTGFYYIGGVFGEQTQIPDWVANIAAPVAFALTAMRFIAAAVSAITGGYYGVPARDESLAKAEKVRAASAALEGAGTESDPEPEEAR